MTANTAYTWAKRPSDARSRVNAGFWYLDEDAALQDVSEYKRPGDRLYRVDVTEIEVPEPEPEEQEEWLWIEHHGRHDKWIIGPSFVTDQYAEARADPSKGMVYLCCIHATRSNAKQAACDAWAEAGFAKAPKTPEPELTWWWVVKDRYEIKATEDCMADSWADIYISSGGDFREYARVQAFDEASAITAAEAAWADLAAQIGGAK